MPKARVLIVDDEPVVLSFCSIALRKNEFDVLLAENGDEGLLIFRELHSEIDLALVDVSMPKIGGIDLARRMFDLKPHPNIILMTGYTPDIVVPTDLQKLCGLLKKPFSARELLNAVEKCLKAERQLHPEISN